MPTIIHNDKHVKISQDSLKNKTLKDFQQNILYEESAVKRTLEILSEHFHYHWTHIHYVNMKRYAIIQGVPNIAILLKKDSFHSFGLKFKDEPEEGDSINVKYVKEFVIRGVKDIYIIFSNGVLYKVSLQNFINNSYKWVQKEGTAVRSISLSHYERIN